MPQKPLSLEQAQRAIDLVAKHGGNVTAASHEAGLSRTTFQHQVERAVHDFKLARPEKPLRVAVNSERGSVGAGPRNTVMPALPQVPIMAPVRDAVKTRHLVIPDTQCKPGVPLDYMRWAGLYAANRRPDKIIHLCDHWDMASLSSYDKGKRSYEGRRYRLDIEAGNKGMDLFMEPIYEEVERSLAEDDDPWQPDLHATLGNHEDRVNRAVDDQPVLHDTIGYFDFNLEAHGWTVHQFLDVVVLDGVAYSHYFASGVMGRPISSARALLTKLHHSAIMGHVQTLETAIAHDVTGKRLTAMFAGCYYPHNESYLGPQTNRATWRGVHMLYGVKDGEFTQNSVDIDYLRSKYATH